MAESVLDNASIGELRALAKSYGVKSERTWKGEDFIAAIKEKQEAGVTPQLVEDNDDTQAEADRLIASYSAGGGQELAAAKGQPKPGYARILLHKDPTPGHSNGHVPVGLNGRTLLVPRGIAVDVPIPYLGVLRDAVQLTRREVKEPDRDNLQGVVVEEEILSYPFQIISLTPGGKFSNIHDQRSQSARRRKAFHSELGRWPTDGELIEWEKANAARGK